MIQQQLADFITDDIMLELSQTVTDQIDHLSRISESVPPAVTRILWTTVDVQGRAYIRRLCNEIGLVMREDSIGNMYARWEGSEPDLPAVATGSHIDAIPNAGKYDGTVGVIGGIAAIRLLKEAGFTPRRSIDLILFTAEEPTRFGIGCLGSRSMTGALSTSDLVKLTDARGQYFDTLRRTAGYNNNELDDILLPENSYAAFVEMHIEQGPVLDSEELPIGIVEHIAAPASLRIKLTGIGGHAGSVLMHDRHDALLAGAQIALSAERIARDSDPNSVMTTGVFRIEPGAINSIPNRALLEIDVRDIDKARRDAMIIDIEQATALICAERGVSWHLHEINTDPPATCDPAIVGTIQHACETLNIGYQRMTSRAYHDALFMARVCPTGMIFIPCRDGVSHRPDEYASPESIATGIHVLAHTLADLSS